MRGDLPKNKKINARLEWTPVLFGGNQIDWQA